jgi:hypothetical protein
MPAAACKKAAGINCHTHMYALAVITNETWAGLGGYMVSSQNQRLKTMKMAEIKSVNKLLGDGNTKCGWIRLSNLSPTPFTLRVHALKLNMVLVCTTANTTSTLTKSGDGTHVSIVPETNTSSFTPAATKLTVVNLDELTSSDQPLQ